MQGSAERRSSQPLELGRLESLLGFHLRMSSACVARDFAQAMSALELTQKQFAVLELVAVNSCVSQIDLAVTLNTDRATMMALVGRLETRGLLGRHRSQTDGRRQNLALTPAGMHLLEVARDRIGRHEIPFRDALGAEAADELIALLRRVCTAAA